MEETKRAVRVVEDEAKIQRSAILNASKVARSTFKLLEEVVLEKDTVIDMLKQENILLKWENEMLKNAARTTEVGTMAPRPNLARDIVATLGGGYSNSEQFGNPEPGMGSGDIWNGPIADHGTGVRTEGKSHQGYTSSARGERFFGSEREGHAQDVFSQNAERKEQPGGHQGAGHWMEPHSQKSPYAGSSGGRPDGRDRNRRMFQSGPGQNKSSRSQPRGGPSDRYQTSRYARGRRQPY
jgi:hypothetical protein